MNENIQRKEEYVLTQNRIRYNQYLEENRHNLESEALQQFHEAEIQRNNLVVSKETHRSNLAREKQAKNELKETKRHNKKGEKLQGKAIIVDKIKAKAAMKSATAAVRTSKAAVISAKASVISAEANSRNADTNARVANAKIKETAANIGYVKVKTQQGRLQLKLDPKLIKIKSFDAKTRRKALYNQAYQWAADYDLKIDFKKMDQLNKKLDRKLKEIDQAQDREKYWVNAVSKILASAAGGLTKK